MQEKRKYNNKKSPKVLIALILALVFILAFAGGYFTNYLFRTREQIVTEELLKILDDAGYIIDPVTGEKREIDEKDIAYALINAFLDDYSAYYTEEEYKAVTSEGLGNRMGIGVSFYSNLPVISKVIGNSPADNAGLEKGDCILSGKESGKEAVQLKSSSEVVNYLTSCNDYSDITLTVERNGKTLDFTMKKGEYITSYVKYYDSQTKYYFISEENGKSLAGKTDDSKKMPELDSATAYVTLDLFEGGAATQLEQALDFMNERGRTKLILDLRDNGGGYMDILTEIAAMLIKNEGKGNFLVTVSENKSSQTEFTSGSYNFKEHLEKISVIANDNTASASECLIGALACYGGAFTLDNLVIEKNAQGVARTYGKGIMQTTYQLLSGGAFKLTTAKIYWPDRKTSIHGTGVVATGDNAVTCEQAIKRAIEILS